MLSDSYKLTCEQVLKHYETDPSNGLKTDQVISQKQQFGLNGTNYLNLESILINIELPKDEGTPLWRLILNQFENQLVQILLGSAVISFALAWFEGQGQGGLVDFVEPIVILLILTANAVVGVAQESSAEGAIEVSQSVFNAHYYNERCNIHIPPSLYPFF